MQTIVVLASVLYLLAHAITQCGFLPADGHRDSDVHVVTSSTFFAGEQTPGHAHIDDGSPHMDHETHTVIAMPRSDNPLRPPTVAALVAIALSIGATLLWARLASRSPPDLPIPIRLGRTTLNDLCINRC